jgi:spermidine synthase
VVGLEQVFGGGVEPPRSGRRVAVVGLGAGTLAAYAEPGDHWTFYEIDPTVARIAQDPSYFTYLSRSRAPWRVVLGDARQSLEVERDPPFDLMILDAYSSDAVPVHLLTREALRLYLDHLAPHGVLAFHISSRHFHLGRVVSSLAQDAGLVYRVRDEDPVSAEETRRGLASASCAVVARTLGDLGALAHDPRWKEPRRRAAIPVWTDDYSSLFPVIAWR